MGQKYALVIGNGDFDDNRLSQLHAPQTDVSKLSEILSDTKVGEFDQVKTLINKGFAEIHLAIADFFADKKNDDVLLFYYSGHGVLDEQGRLYLVVKDTIPNRLSGSAISTRFVTDEMDGSRSKRQILILDCCYSGAFTRGRKSGTQVINQGTFEGGARGKVVLTATDETEFAWEGDQIIGEVNNSLFTHFLLEGLRDGNADRDGDGVITLDEWYDYTYEQVVMSSSRQKPRKWVYGQEGDPLVIAKSPNIAFTPASASVENAVYIDHRVTCLALAPTRDQFVVGDRRGVIQVRNIQKQILLKSINTGQKNIRSLVCSPVDDIIAVGYGNGSIALWSSTGELINEPIATDSPVVRLSFSPDGKRLLSSHKPSSPAIGTVKLWSVQPLTLQSVFIHENSTTFDAKFLPNGSGFVSAGSDRSVTHYDFESNKVLFSERKHTGTVTCLAMHPIGGIVVSGSWSGSAKIWNLENGDNLATIDAHANRITCLAFTPSGHILATGSKDGQVSLWLMPHCIPMKRLTPHEGWLIGLVFSDDHTLITLGSEGICKTWRVRYHLSEETGKHLSGTDVLNSFLEDELED